MARHWFGQSPADWTFAVGAGNSAILAGGITISFYNAPTGGIAYTDLLDDVGTPAATITSADGTELPLGTIPRFQGPDGVVAMWADAGAGVRYLMVATDIGDVIPAVAANTATIATLQAAVNALAEVASTGAYSDLVGKPALADVATSGDYSDLDGAPPPGLQYVSKVGGSWPVRASTAPDSTRIALWIGPAPAPPNGAGYSQDGDIWMATAS